MAAILFTLAAVPSAHGQEIPQATVALSHDSVVVGDSFIYQITVDGAQSAEAQFPSSDAYKAEFLGGRDESSHSIFTVNGRTTETNRLRYVMQWRVTPLKAGSGAIDGFPLKAGSQTMTIPRTEYRATDAEKNANFQLSLEAAKTDVYVGEPIHLRMVWSLGRDVKSAAFSGPDGGKDFDVRPTDPRPAKARSNPGQGNDPYRIVPFLDGQFVLARTQVAREDGNVPAYSADLIITPRRAGKIEVGPYRVAFDEVVGQRQRSFFDAPWDDLSQTRRSVVASNAVTLNVNSLPQEGRPADFDGLIGEYSLDASIAAEEASVGDPVPLTLTIHGPEPLDAVKPPTLESQPEVSTRFKTAPEGWEPSTAAAQTGARTFTTTIRPTSDSVTQVPAIRLPYFDTKSGRYDVALSKPIPLRVRAAREVTLADAIRPGALPGISLPPGSAPASLTDAPAGIGANTESLSALVNQQVSLLAMLRTPEGIAFVATPPLALAFVALVAHRKRARDPKEAQRHRALLRARRGVQAAAAADQVSLALRAGLAPFLGAEACSITSGDVTASTLPARAATPAAELLADLEGAEFDSRPIELAAAKARAMKALQELGRTG
jgi:hypothetical protein